jgi:hypothetical protein
VDLADVSTRVTREEKCTEAVRVQLAFQGTVGDPEGTTHENNAIDRLDTAATYSAAAQLRGFGHVHAPLSMLYGFRPAIFSSSGESLWQRAEAGHTLSLHTHVKVD